MKTIRNPAEFPEPLTYSHGIEVPAGGCTLYIAGQIGVNADGTAPSGVSAQTRLAFANIDAVLKTAGMTFENVVKTTVFLVNRSDYDDFAKARSSILGSNKPASTLVYVSGLIRPELLVEIEAIAVAPSPSEGQA